MSLGIETFLKPVFPLLPESRVSEKRKRVMVLVTLWGWRDCWSIPPGEADTEAKAETLKTKFCSFTQTPHLGTMVLGHSMVLGREPGFPVHTLPSRIATLGVCLWGRWVWRLWKQFQEFPATQNPSGQGSSSTLVFKSELYKEDRNRTVLARIPPGKMHLSALTPFLAPITISLEIFWSLSPLSSLSSRWAGIAYFFFLSWALCYNREVNKHPWVKWSFESTLQVHKKPLPPRANFLKWQKCHLTHLGTQNLQLLLQNFPRQCQDP